MKKRFTEAQIIGFLQEAEAGVPEAKRLKKLLAESMLDKEALETALRKKSIDPTGAARGHTDDAY